jgi:hypothetical protein
MPHFINLSGLAHAAIHMDRAFKCLKMKSLWIWPHFAIIIRQASAVSSRHLNLQCSPIALNILNVDDP